jgi:hypothetical protein
MHVTNRWKLALRGTIGLLEPVVVAEFVRLATGGEPLFEPHPAARIGSATTANRREFIPCDSGGEL